MSYDPMKARREAILKRANPELMSRLVMMLPPQKMVAEAAPIEPGAVIEEVIPDGVEQAAVMTAPGTLRVAPSASKLTRSVTGPLVRAGEANRNGALFLPEDLAFGLPSLVGSPLNINHSSSMGAYGWIETATLDAQPDLGNYIDIVGKVWANRYPQMWQQIETAIAQGTAALSMECVASAIGCQAEGCGVEAASVDKFCEHIRNRSAARRQIDPTFFGGAIVLPPEQPGWSDARLRLH